MKVLLGIIIVLVLFAGSLLIAWTIWDFLVETPKQLKRIADKLERIADELERGNKHGN